MSRIREDQTAFTRVEIATTLAITCALGAVAVLSLVRIRIQEIREKPIINNMRRLNTAAEQYFMEYGTNTVLLASIVGPSAYIRALNTVYNESYPLVLTRGQPIVVSGIGKNGTLTYPQ